MAFLGNIYIAETRITGSAFGQKVQNTLYHWFGVNAFEELVGTDLIEHAQQLADTLGEQWRTQVMPVISDAYELQRVEVKTYAIEEGLPEVFRPVLSADVAKGYSGQFGGRAGATNGPDTAMNFRFYLAPNVLTELAQPPRYGYIAVGPLTDADIGDDGTFETGGLWNTEYRSKVEAAETWLAKDDLHTGGVFDWWTYFNDDIAHPCRVRKAPTTAIGDPGKGVQGIIGFGDVTSVVHDNRRSTRRSRRVEA